MLFEASGADEPGETENIEQVIQEFLPFLEEQGVLWLDGKFIIHPHLTEKEDYIQLLRIQNKEYCIPDRETLQRYALGKFAVKNKEYEKVFRLLNKELKDKTQTENILEELAEYVTEEDLTPADIMNYLYDWEMVFESEKSAERLVKALEQWLNTIRRWSKCGHSINELHEENREPEPAKKIYPNDPCPCGSGKKYKKCCGRK